MQVLCLGFLVVHPTRVQRAVETQAFKVALRTVFRRFSFDIVAGGLFYQGGIEALSTTCHWCQTLRLWPLMLSGAGTLTLVSVIVVFIIDQLPL